MSPLLEEHLPGWGKFLQVIEGLSERTARSYLAKTREFNIWLVKERGLEDVSAISRQDIEGFLEKCFYAGNENTTRLTKLVAIRKFVTYLAYQGILKDNITAGIPRPRVWKQFPQTLTRDEVLKLFAAIPFHTEIGLRDAVFVMCGVFLGMRLSEIINLTITDVVDDEGGNSLLFTIKNSKFHSHRVVKLWKIPSELVRRWQVIRFSQGAKKSDPLLITYTKSGKPKHMKLASATIDVIVKRYAKKAQINKHVFFHVFRATHATNLRHIASYDLPAIAARLGHRCVDTTASRYLADWDRIRRTYPSLAIYWKDFNKLVLGQLVSSKSR
jgi:integrase/recombinase XerD